MQVECPGHTKQAVCLGERGRRVVLLLVTHLSLNNFSSVSNNAYQIHHIPHHHYIVCQLKSTTFHITITLCVNSNPPYSTSPLHCVSTQIHHIPHQHYIVCQLKSTTFHITIILCQLKSTTFHITITVCVNLNPPHSTSPLHSTFSQHYHILTSQHQYIQCNTAPHSVFKLTSDQLGYDILTLPHSMYKV